MAEKDKVKQLLAKPIQLADQIIKAAEYAARFKADCAEIKSKTEKLAALLRQAARASNDLYERPTRRIIEDTEQVLDKTLTLVFKCRYNGIRRIFIIIPNGSFRKASQQLENSIGDVQWLLRVSAPADDRDDEYLGLPPIAANEPILCLIWEQIAILCSGSIEDRSDAAASLVSLARDNDRYGKLIIEEGGVMPLLKLAKEGRKEGQENAARAVGLLGRDPESVEAIVAAGVAPTFDKMLKDCRMQVQVVVAWAISELTGNFPQCQDSFAFGNDSKIIRHLVSHLAFETIQEHSKYAIAAKRNITSIHAVLMANPSDTTSNNPQDEKLTDNIARPVSSQMQNVISNTMAISSNQKTAPTTNSVKFHPTTTKTKSNHQSNLTGKSIKGKEYEDPETKAQMKTMAARALWHLCIGNVAICKNITESRALLCFAVLLEKGHEEVQYNAAMALMEITAVAEQHSGLRRSAFKPTSTTSKAVVDQFLRIIEKEEPYLIIPSIKSIGNLARTFRATETRFVVPLVRLLDERETDVTIEAAVALVKFACTDNYLHEIHSKAIIEAGGAKHLIQLVYFGEHAVQVPSLVLLCYLAMHVPESDALAQEEVLIVLEWATKKEFLREDSSVETLVLEGKTRLELYSSRGARGFH